MNPLGIGLAFMVFWAAIGFGLFLFFWGAIKLGNTRRVYGIAVSATGHMTASIVYTAVLVFGLALVAVGAYANFIVLYR